MTMKNTKTAGALVGALGLLLASGAAFAQLSCVPATPSTDPGTGFVAFGEREQLLARGGNAGPPWEWAAVSRRRSPAPLNPGVRLNLSQAARSGSSGMRR